MVGLVDNSWLIRIEFAREMILEAGGLDEILSLVKDPSCCLTSLRYCCYAIGNLVTSLSGMKSFQDRH